MYEFFHQLMNAGILLSMVFGIWGLALAWNWITKEKRNG